MLVSDLVSHLNSTVVEKPIQIRVFSSFLYGVSCANVANIWSHRYASRFDGYLREPRCALDHRWAFELSQDIWKEFKQGGGLWHRLPNVFQRKVSLGAPSTDRYAFTILETAKSLGVSRSTIYRLIASGDLEVIYIRRAPRIPDSEIQRYLRRQASRQRISEVKF